MPDLSLILSQGLTGVLAELRLYFAEFFFGTFFPAFIFAAAIKCFIRERALTRWLGGEVHKALSYTVALVSGLLFSVCACGVLPLFASVYRHGAGIGPAVTFLVAGPAINVTAIILTWPFFGWSMTACRTVTTLAMALAIGLVFDRLYGHEDAHRTAAPATPAADGDDLLDPAYNYLADEELDDSFIPKPAWQVALLMGVTFLYMTVGPVDFGNYMERSAGNLLKAGLLFGYLAFLIVYTLTALDRTERRDWLAVVGHFIWKISWPLVLGLAMLGFAKGNLSNGFATHVVTTWMGSGSNPLVAVILSALIAVPSYFGTCVSVVYVKLFVDFGMSQPAALAMFLGGPTISVASYLPLVRVMGFRRATLLAGLIFLLTVLLALACIPFLR